jgi:hypothetical protein
MKARSIQLACVPKSYEEDLVDQQGPLGTPHANSIAVQLVSGNIFRGYVSRTQMIVLPLQNGEAGQPTM